MPSNDIASGYSPLEYMNNLRSLFRQIQDAGVKAFITTPQPRNDLDDAQRQLLRNLVDSVNNQFGMYAVDFWSDIVTNDGQNRIRPEVSSPADLIHINNLGHRLVFEEVLSENLFTVNSPLPVAIGMFKAKRVGREVELMWTTSSEEPNTVFLIQRSNDGIGFADIANISGRGLNGNGSYTWLDRNPLQNKSYYRLKVTEPGRQFFTSTISVSTSSAPFNIKRVRLEGSAVVYEIDIDQSQEAIFTVSNSMGQIVVRQESLLLSPSSVIRLPVQKLASGQYYVSIATGKGQKLTSSFVK